MEKVNELIDLLNQFLNSKLHPTFFWQQGWVQQLLVTIQAIVVIVSAIGGLWKYKKTKNISLYEKILKEVYAPLYLRIVRQEYVRNLLGKDEKLKLEEVPVIISVSKKFNTTIKEGNISREEEVSKSPLLCEDNFLEVLLNTNFGLAPKRLVELIGMYQMACDCQKKYKDDRSDIGIKNAIFKFKIEYDLVLEIINGYNTYYKKLGLDNKKISYMDYIEEKDKMELNLKVTDQEIANLKKRMATNPREYM